MMDGWVRTLKGAPLSVLHALWLYGPSGRDDLVVATGYSINAVSQALAFLEHHLGYIERHHYRQWRLSPNTWQLPLPSLALPEGSSGDLSAESASTAVVDNLVDNRTAPVVPSAERSPRDLSTGTPPHCQSPSPNPVEGSFGDLSEAERSPGDLSAFSALGGIGLVVDQTNSINQTNTTPTAWPIAVDQSSEPDRDLWQMCQRLGIRGTAQLLIASSRFIQQRGPAYIQLHMRAAASDRDRRGSVAGLAINRMYRLLPGLDCGDCGRCNRCRQHYRPAFVEPSIPADLMDVIRR